MAYVIKSNASLFANNKELNVVLQRDSGLSDSRMALRIRAEQVVLGKKQEARALVALLQAALESWDDA
jgi:hypothetical protein